MHIHVDRDLCNGHGQCVLWAPEVFRMGADGISEVVNDSPDASLRTKVDDAIQSCPVGALTLHD